MENRTLKAQLNYNGISAVVEYTCTNHFLKRSRQRAITDEQVAYAISTGKEVQKQGYIFYIVGDKVAKGGALPQERKKVKNLVVVTCATDNILITTYRNNDPFKHVGKKSKRLAA
jgi:hypothetical protein